MPMSEKPDQADSWQEITESDLCLLDASGVDMK